MIRSKEKTSSFFYQTQSIRASAWSSRKRAGFLFRSNVFLLQKRKRFGQIAVEFFLIAGFVLMLAVGLLVLVGGQIDSTSNLAKVASARTVIDGISANARIVWLSGHGSRINQTFFVPDNTICFLHDSIENRLYCVVGAATQVKGQKLSEILVEVKGKCSVNGEVEISTENKEDKVEISC